MPGEEKLTAEETFTIVNSARLEAVIGFYSI